MSIPCRRFGRTNINIPVLSLGGMRFQKSWQQLSLKDISRDDQNKVDKLIHLADKYGFDHIETARHYGTSEMQLGKSLTQIDRASKIIQTKIPPTDNLKIFEEELRSSFEKLGVKKIELLSIHGINTPEHLNQAIKKGGCVDVLQKWRNKNLIDFIGFSTHGKTSLIEKAIASNKFDYVNLHWYFINQRNIKAIQLARKYDLGVFIISPTDKGGHLHTPTAKLIELCKPLHPIVFNDLFCLRNESVHTISVGVAKETDFDYHLEAVSLLSNTEKYVPMIEKKLTRESIKSLGFEWYSQWDVNLPKWEDTPGDINIPVLIWLSNLIDAWDMEEFARSRYQLLGNGGHWFPGKNANLLDINVSEADLYAALRKHHNPKKIIQKLHDLKSKFGGGEQTRLSVE